MRRRVILKEAARIDIGINTTQIVIQLWVTAFSSATMLKTASLLENKAVSLLVFCVAASALLATSIVVLTITNSF